MRFMEQIHVDIHRAVFVQWGTTEAIIRGLYYVIHYYKVNQSCKCILPCMFHVDMSCRFIQYGIT